MSIFNERFKNGVTPLNDTNLNEILDRIKMAGEPILQEFDFLYTGSVQTITLDAGQYKLRCWGAEGGSFGDPVTGKGGYTEGDIVLTESTLLRIYVGGQGGQKSHAGGWNGGGSTGSYGGSGGGATDIRIGGETLEHRVIVAAGGGGSGYGSPNGNGGAAGGENGIEGQQGTLSKGGRGGTQNAGGIVGTGGTGGNPGVFGKGGNGNGTIVGANGYGTNVGNGGGGGGGWYGGGSGQSGSRDSAGGGGSSYVLTSQSFRPSGYVHGTSSPYNMSNVVNKNGGEVFLSPSGVSVTGNSGNGYVKIEKAVLPCAIVKDGITYEWLTGSTAPASNLGKLGDMYLDTSANNVYKKTNSTNWTLQCNIKGVKGDKGDKGDTGATGVGAIGPQGPTGPQGPIGPQGPKGETSAAVYDWLTGSSTPASNLGKQGDMYLNTSNSYVYKKTSSTIWTFQCEIKGAQGATGLQGLKGDKGDKGDKGEKGDTGATGLQGPQGKTGATGERGPQGEQGHSGGVTSPVDGFFTMYVNENGDLMLLTSSEGTDKMRYDPTTGNLYYKII